MKSTGRFLPNRMSSFVRCLLPIPGSSRIVRNIESDLLRRTDISTRFLSYNIFAERAIQSLKHIIYRYIEDLGEKFIHKLSQFVSTMNYRINRSNGKKPKRLISSQFCTIKLQQAIKDLKSKLEIE